MSDHKWLGMTNEPQLLAHGTSPARQTVLSGPLRLDSKIVVIERKYHMVPNEKETTI